LLTAFISDSSSPQSTAKIRTKPHATGSVRAQSAPGRRQQRTATQRRSQLIVEFFTEMSAYLKEHGWKAAFGEAHRATPKPGFTY
jgi:hypothetical protein